MNFDAFVNDIKEHGWKVFGTEVYEFGKLIHSYGDNSGLHGTVVIMRRRS